MNGDHELFLSRIVQSREEADLLNTERALNRQIYKLQQVVAMAKEDEVFRELLAIARGKR